MNTRDKAATLISQSANRTYEEKANPKSARRAPWSKTPSRLRRPARKKLNVAQKANERYIVQKRAATNKTSTKHREGTQKNRTGQRTGQANNRTLLTEEENLKSGVKKRGKGC
jgi:hypothetical protein